MQTIQRYQHAGILGSGTPHRRTSKLQDHDITESLIRFAETTVHYNQGLPVISAAIWSLTAGASPPYTLASVAPSAVLKVIHPSTFLRVLMFQHTQIDLPKPRNLQHRPPPDRGRARSVIEHRPCHGEC